MNTRTTLGDLVRRLLLLGFSFITNYRYRKHLDGLALPNSLRGVKDEDEIETQIRDKATASLTSVSAFLGFTVAVLVPLALWDKFISVLSSVSFKEPHESIENLTILTSASGRSIICAIAALILTYATFWFERFISVEEEDQKKKRGTRSKYLVLFLLASLFLVVGMPILGRGTQWPDALQKGFGIAGASMLIVSIFFLVCALEFYDEATVGWRGGVGLHFHFASLASHCYMFGISLALTGLALILCLVNFFVGRVMAAITLIVLVTMTEIERRLSDLGEEKPIP